MKVNITDQFDNMGKLALRSACRDAKVKGYSKMTVAAMRAALAQITTVTEPEVVVTPPKPKPAPAKKKAAPAKQKIATRPKPGGKCAVIWDWLDKHRDATIADVKAIAAKKGWNENNAAIELYAWRKFCGITSKGTRKLEGAIILEDGAAISIDEND